MKRIILCLSLFAFFGSQAQQINPVPDYVFSNKMSVGRNAVTDTAAYFSIGPRYGAIRGMMPPMVTDTASMSATKRNGLLIFSIQKNKYLYWDSVGSKWAEMAGTAGSAITGSGVAGYMPEFTTATNIDTTRLYHSNGRFAIGSTTTTNGVFNVYNGRAYFDTSVLIGTNVLFADEANGRVGIGTTSPSYRLTTQITGSGIVADFSSDENAGLQIRRTGTSSGTTLLNQIDGGEFQVQYPQRVVFIGNSVERMRINQGGELLIGTTTDAGAYALQVAGSIYNTTGAVFAASSGNVGIGTASPTDKLRVIGTIRGDVTRSETYSQFQYWYPAFSYMSTTNATPSDYATTLNGTLYFRGFDSSQVSGLGSVGWTLGVHATDNAYGYAWQLASDFNGSIALRAASSSAAWKTPYMLWKSDGEVLVGTTSDAGTYALQVTGAIYNTTTITTGAPTGGSIKPWRLGEAATVSPTSPNRTIRVEIDGTVYYIHAKTTND